MKIKEGFIKRQVGERVVVVPIGDCLLYTSDAADE